MKKTFLVFLVFMLIGTLTIGGLTINVLAEEDSESTGLG